MQSLDPAAASIIPPELTGPTPRRVRFEPWMLVWPTLMFGVFSGIPIYQTANQVHHRNMLRQNGVDVLGWVNNAWMDGRGSGIPTVAYTFEVDGTNHTGNEEVPKDIYPTLHRGDVLEVRYAQSNPSVNHPAGWEWSSDWADFVVPLIGVAAVVFYASLLRPRRRLAIAGMPAVATVTGTRRGRNGPIVNYEFRAEDGIYQGSDSSSQRKENGAHICVLYLPGNPNRNAIYPLDAYCVVPTGEV